MHTQSHLPVSTNKDRLCASGLWKQRPLFLFLGLTARSDIEYSAEAKHRHDAIFRNEPEEPRRESARAVIRCRDSAD
jgi:hypothetical protein